jgi:RNA polymerase sigma factor (sigma-70 family)
VPTARRRSSGCTAGPRRCCSASRCASRAGASSPTRCWHDVARVESYHDSLDDNPDASLDRLYDWDADDGEEARLDAGRARAFVRRCLGELSPAERQSLVLAYEHGLSHNDLAAHLGKPLGTVKTWIRRGMDNLRKCVEHCMGAAT